MKAIHIFKAQQIEPPSETTIHSQLLFDGWLNLKDTVFWKEAILLRK